MTPPYERAIKQIEKEQLDAEIVLALPGYLWLTADELAAKIGRSRSVDATTVGHRLRSLKSRKIVRSRVHTRGYYSIWTLNANDLDRLRERLDKSFPGEIVDRVIESQP